MHEAAGVNYYQLLIKNGKMIYATKLVSILVKSAWPHYEAAAASTL
jgi:hypothetical protein